MSWPWTAPRRRTSSLSATHPRPGPRLPAARPRRQSVAKSDHPRILNSLGRSMVRALDGGQLRIKLPDIAPALQNRGGSHGIVITSDQKTLLVNSGRNSAVYAYSLPDLKLIGS